MSKEVVFTVHLSDDVLRALLSGEQEEWSFTYGDENGGYNSETVVVKKGNKLPDKMINDYVYKVVRV